MGGDERRPLASRVLERRVDSGVDAHERAAANGDGMRGEIGIEVVVRQFDAGEEQQVVLTLRALSLRIELGEILGVVAAA